MNLETHILLRCPDCKREMEVERDESDYQEAVRVEFRCVECDDGDFAGDEFGSICWSVRVSTYGKDQDQVDTDNSLRITDCYKVINLQIDFGNDDEYRARVRKLDALLESLKDLKAEMKKAHTVIKKHPKWEKKEE